MTVATALWAIVALLSAGAALACGWRLRATRRALETTRRIVDKAVDSIIVADLVDGCILTANEAAAALLGRSVAEVTRLKITDILPGHLVDRSAELVAEAWESGGITTTDLCFEDARGTQIPVEISGTVVAHERGSAVVIFARDIRARKELEARLVQSQKVAALGELVAGVAHEMNTPLGTLRSCIHTSQRAMTAVRDTLAGNEGEPPRTLSRSLSALDSAFLTGARAADRIDAIVRGLRNFARLDEAERKVVDVHEGLDSTLTLLGHLMGDDVQVVKHYGDLPPIECRPSQLNQVFMQVLKNAVEAVGGRGTISIATREEDQGLRIDITDTGAGIDPKDLDRIFDPGFTTRGVGVGTGLGLAISRQILDQHGGWIAADSTVGQGTAISLWLPRSPSSPGSRPAG